jgi:hypothetical protein
MNCRISREKWLVLIVAGYIRIIRDFSNTFPDRWNGEGFASQLPAMTFVDSVSSSTRAAQSCRPPPTLQHGPL